MLTVCARTVTAAPSGTKLSKRTCDWYIPKIDPYIEFWEKKARGDPRAIEVKQKFYNDHSLRAIDIYENDLQLADRVIPARIREAVPKCKFRNLVKETGQLT